MVSNIVRMAGIVKSGYDEVTSAMKTISTFSEWSQVLQEDPNLHGNLMNLRNLLPKAAKLIERSECWRIKYDEIDSLLPDLKSAAYDATSMNNELTYQESKVQALNRNATNELLSSYTTNVVNWLTGYPRKVKEARDKLNNVCDQLKQACDRYDIPKDPNEVSRAQTTSSIAEPEVFGRVEELNTVISSMQSLGREDELNQVIRLVENITDGSSSRKRTRKNKMIDTPESSGMDKRENLSVLAIVGVGGVGKTTLAQMVCRSKNVKDCFKIIWICVSDNFDVVRLTKEIIERAGNDNQKKNGRATSNLDALQNIMVNCLESRRFLLVMDDVWSEIESDWKCFFGPLRDIGGKGSMVIVTTRSHKTADITETVNMNRITLKGLEPKIYWDFFKSCAFRSTNSENYPELENIGKEIIVKLNGSPLAAKTVGGLLGIDLNGQHWRNIRDSEIWQLPQEDGSILPVLQLSYQYLPSHLKKCFSFCSLFPKDYNFKETELIRFWISEGFIDPRLLPQAEIVAKNYIHTLLNRCFFGQAPEKNKEYVIHDLMHDVAQLITKDECFLIENENFERKISNNDIRHLSIFNREFKLESFKKIAKCNKLHSLIIRPGGTCGINAIKSWCKEFTNVCSLSLSRSNKIKRLPDSIGNLKHLRYLDVSHTGIEQLPDSFCELYKLEFLNMEGCKHFKCFPKYSNLLISIKLLILPDKEGLSWRPSLNFSLVRNIPNLAQAIQLDRLQVTIKKGDDNTVGDLKFLNGIYGILEIIELQNVSNKSEAQEAKLNKKKLVSKLVLNWSKSDETNESHEEVLEGLCPQPNLKTLQIFNYKGKTFPNWLHKDYLTNIMSFEIYSNDITTVPCLPHSLTMLTILNCSRLTDLENCLMPTNLPSLKDLNICDCPNLICSSEMALPPSIQSLSLRSCGQLEDRFFSILPNLTSFTSLEICDFGRLTSISDHNVLRNLEHLTISDCSKLRSIGGPEVFASVKNISIVRCPKLEGIKGGNFFKVCMFPI